MIFYATNKQEVQSTDFLFVLCTSRKDSYRNKMKLYVVLMAVIGMVASQTTSSPVAENTDSCKTNVYHVQSLTQV